MKKLLFQGLLSIVVFMGTLFLLQQVNWMRIFHIQQTTDKVQQRLGDLFWEVYKQTDAEIDNNQIVIVVDSLLTKLCKANQIERSTIHLHILKKDEVNAFALPNGHLVVYTGLLLKAENAEQLAGVLAHEMAHMQLHHVMKKLTNEIGLSVLFSVTTGKNPELIKQIAKTLSSSAFERKLEKEADMKAVDYLNSAKINPIPFADFLLMLSNKDKDGMPSLSWLQSHPDSKERSEYIRAYVKQVAYVSKYKPILMTATWEKLQSELN
jgi:predicted Zn-dependent protease